MTKGGKNECANALVCALCTILVLSFIGANVLVNCTTRLNVASAQVRAWKESLHAAETGGDIAYGEVRKLVLDPTRAFSGWTNAGSTHSSPTTTLGADNLTTSSVVDQFYTDPITGNSCYRIRTTGTAPVQGLKRSGMDNRMLSGARGDNLLRKIDLYHDHFTAAYGPAGDGVAKALVAVPRAQVTRRIELIAAPVNRFDVAVKCTATFTGPGPGGVIDSYNSINGPYYFAANNSADVHYGDSHSGSVQVGAAVFNLGGTIWGDVTTNGANVIPSANIHGIIDNNVPFTVPPCAMPTNLPAPSALLTTVAGIVNLRPLLAGTPAVPNFYQLSSLSGSLTISPALVGLLSLPVSTYVAIHVTNDMTAKIVVKPNVHAQIYFDGNMAVPAGDIVNESGTASDLQYYAISSSTPGTTQTISIASPGNFSAVIYAPNADVTLTGNPTVTGAIVCKNYNGNGNTSWHYDTALNVLGTPVDYRLISYVEDTR